MTLAALLPLVLKYGLVALDLTPQILSVVSKIEADIAAGRGNKVVTAEDLAELKALAAQTSDAIYEREGITPPPSANA